MDISPTTPIATFTTTPNFGSDRTPVSRPVFATALLETDTDYAGGISRTEQIDVVKASGSLDDAIAAAGDLAHARMKRGVDQSFGVLNAGEGAWNIVGLGRRVGSGTPPWSPADPVTPSEPLYGAKEVQWSPADLSRNSADITVEKVAPELAAIVGVSYDKGNAAGNLVKKF